jgi:hypothetical protein
LDLADKLQLKKGQSVRILDAPEGFALSRDPTGPDSPPEALLVFALNAAKLKHREREIVLSVRDDRLTWVAFPKAGKKGTDLSRDILASRLHAKGVQVVRAVSIDDIWSALRFRPPQEE